MGATATGSWRRRAGWALAAVSIGVAVAAAAAPEAGAGRYSVVQCGWRVGADADWADTTGGAKFRPGSYCVAPAGADPFDGVHLKSFAREGEATVSGNRFGRWRWVAPPATAITQVRGTWWHALHDGFQHRLGGVGANGFAPVASAAATDTALRDFAFGFAPGVGAFESRLLCARAESKWCSLAPQSWSGVRALTLTLEDGSMPAAGIGGDLLAGGWRRGVQGAVVWGADAGAGIRFGETTLDGARVALTEYPCAAVQVGGEWRGTRLIPCPPESAAPQAVATGAFSDGPHSVRHCVTDFSGNQGCTGPFTVLIDNNPPAAPRQLTLGGEEGWRRANDFDLAWVNPDQGPASPLAGAGWRLTGPAGHDSGPQFGPGRDRSALADLKVTGPGTYSLSVWLRDEAGNENPAAAATVALRFDDVAPGLAFRTADVTGAVEAEVSDAHSGPARGEIRLRRAGSDEWTELPTRLLPGTGGDPAVLRAPLPDLGPGLHHLRAEAADRAGNLALSARRADGTEMAIRVAPTEVARRQRSRLRARLAAGREAAQVLSVGFGAPVALSGRLVGVDGAGLAGREVEILVRPSRGALTRASSVSARTGERGRFELRLPPGPSRRISVRFAGDAGFEPAGFAGLGLRVRSGVQLRAAARRLGPGEPLRLRGRVHSRGAGLPRRGKLVEIQYLERAARRWRPVLVTRTDGEGRFRASYRFRYLTADARVRLRARALAEERWPYAPGASRPVTVTVRAR